MKKIIGAVLISILTINLCWSQDTIVTKKNENIASKVLEVTTSEIKYKKFDNLDGPIYSLLKADVFLIKYSNGTKDTFIPLDSSSSNITKLYVYRGCRFYVGSATKVKLYCNDKLICSIPTCSGYTCSFSKTGKYVLFFKGGGCFVGKKVIINVNSEGKDYYVRYDIGAMGCSYSIVPQTDGCVEYKNLKYHNEEIKIN